MDCSIAADSLCKYIIILMLWKYSSIDLKRWLNYTSGNELGKINCLKKHSVHLLFLCDICFCRLVMKPYSLYFPIRHLWMANHFLLVVGGQILHSASWFYCMSASGLLYLSQTERYSTYITSHKPEVIWNSLEKLKS